MTMLFSAKSAPPIDAEGGFSHSTLKQAVDGKITLFIAAPGYLLADSLAGEIAHQNRPVVWLRLGPEDCDPATLLLSLIASTRRILPAFGSSAIDEMRKNPGPIYGWAPLFSHLGHELAENTSADTVFVIEHLEHLDKYPLTYQLLSGHLLSLLSRRNTCVLIANKRLPAIGILEQTRQRGIDDLRLDLRDSLILAESVHTSLPGAHLRKAISLTDGRAVALLGVYVASNILGRDFIMKTVDQAKDAQDLLMRIAREFIHVEEPDTLKALSLVWHLDYFHPDLFASILPDRTLPIGPWFQPLEDGWTRVRGIWHKPLQAALKSFRVGSEDDLNRAAAHLASQGALPQALRLYFYTKDLDSAAREIALHLPTLLDLGQWETLTSGINQLPLPTLNAWPRLVYTRGEISAAHGNFENSLNDFATAAALFSAQHEHVGACQSLLAESAVSVRLGNYDHALTAALAARGIATISGLAWYRGWALWQLGSIAELSGKVDEALAYFNQAVKIIDDPFLKDYYREVEKLATAQRESHRQREFHQQAYHTAVKAESEATNRLNLALNSPLQDLGEFLKQYGWSHTPIFIKLPSAPPGMKQEDAQDGSLWEKILNARHLAWRPHQAVKTSPALDLAPPIPLLHYENETIALPSVLPDEEYISYIESPAQELKDAPIVPLGGEMLSSSPPVTAPKHHASVHQVSTRTGENVPPQKHLMTAYLLGNFRLFVDELAIEKWPGGRSRSLFKYLLVHRQQRLPREVLMEAFWPGASPESARNSLNVALHDLRKVFRVRIKTPVIEYHEGAYQFNPDLSLWLDVEEFERYLLASQRLEDAGQPSLAVNELEVAASLYQGDFMADDPYEAWAVLDRTHLQIAYLDLLDRLSNMYFSQGQYSACVTLCQRILERDNCREDAHRRLMRCYSRQGQHHLALRQYQLCIQTLQHELGVDPEQDTLQLAERIRRHERV